MKGKYYKQRRRNRSTITWLAEIRIDRALVGEGFVLTSSRLTEMLEHELGIEPGEYLIQAEVVDAPKPKAIMAIQGHGSIEEMLGCNLIVKENDIIESALSL